MGGGGAKVVIAYAALRIDVVFVPGISTVFSIFACRAVTT